MKLLRPVLSLLALLAICIAPTACSHDDVWGEVPDKIEQFINRYFPNSELSSCSSTGGSYRVRIKNGPGLTFDSACEWTAIAGYGETMPQVLVFDQLPPALYDYLEEIQAVAKVYSMERDKSHYTIGLQNTSVVYDTVTGKITSPVPPV